jgi:SAM-dependent methyltransferase
MAEEYASARPPYPRLIFELLRSQGAIGPGLQVLEVGAGAGLATRELVASGSQVVAIEPGRDLSALLAAAVPEAQIVSTSLEDASLPTATFDSVVAATSLHWVNLLVALPKLHSTLRPHGRLAVFRTIFGDDTVHTEFRDRVKQIVATREQVSERAPPESRPTLTELSAGGHFRPARSERWRWSIDLSTDQVTRLFSTFSAWTDEEVAAIRVAADDCGGVVTEHYQSVLHLLIRG